MNTESKATYRFPVDPEFGTRIREARKGKNISAKRLANTLDVPVSLLMHIERGDVPIESAKLLVGLATELDIPKEKLLILATKRTYNELMTDLDRNLKEIPNFFGGMSEDEIFKRAAESLDMTEDELWESVAQELINYEICGRWSDEGDEDDDDLWDDLDEHDDEDDAEDEYYDDGYLTWEELLLGLFPVHW